MTNPAAEIVETHSSVLIFTSDKVYKVKKAVNLGFLDFRERSARRSACQAEVELNQRLSPDVYLGVADLMGPDGTPWESMVVMRRMPEHRRLSTLVTGAAEGLPAELRGELRALGQLIATFHQHCPTSPTIASVADPEALARLWRDNVDVLRQHVPQILDQALVDEIDQLSATYLAGREPLLRHRQETGLVRDGHGDLQAGDIFLLDDGPRVLDCLEFDARLRCGDVLNDVAFLAMDLERLGAPEAARTFLDSYAEFSGEQHPRSLEDHYLAYRAGVRSKVACLRWAQGDQEAATLARTFAELALRHLRSGQVRLILVGGLPGTGKSSLAASIAGGRGWTLLRSDVVRKELAGIPATEPAPSDYGGGLYTDDSRRSTYDELFRRARRALELGEHVLLDASFTDDSQRNAARLLAAETHSRMIEFECTAPAAVVSERLATRGRQGTDASDADQSIASAMAARHAPWPAAMRLDTSTDLAAVTRTALQQIESDPELRG